MSEELKATNWPDLNRPGVPLFPERDGWHVVTFWRSDRQVTGFWHAGKQKWESIDGVYTFTPQDAVNNIKYDAASLTPTQINEMLAAERERCAKICDEFTPDKGSIADDAFLTGRYLALVGIAEKIRNLGAES